MSLGRFKEILKKEIFDHLKASITFESDEIGKAIQSITDLDIIKTTNYSITFTIQESLKILALSDKHHSMDSLVSKLLDYYENVKKQMPSISGHSIVMQNISMTIMDVCTQAKQEGLFTQLNKTNQDRFVSPDISIKPWGVSELAGYSVFRKIKISPEEKKDNRHVLRSIVHRSIT